MAEVKKADKGNGENLFSPPSISLPKGGGAIRGIGEKFAANPVTGTGSMSVPIATSPGRSGFGPQLSLSYDSGYGNSAFGFGWSLSLPSITRKTEKGLPKYLDADESDVFILSGAEDLVPVPTPAGVPDPPEFTIQRYRPRIEGLFARIERWTAKSNGVIHWRSISRDNITTLYGKDNNSRIYDPSDPDPQHPTRIFSWLICETRDDKGNAVLYEYKPEDGIGVDLTRAHERNRGDREDVRRSANCYLKRIRYGNRMPLLDNAGLRPLFLTAAQIQNAGWMFEVVFDYGEHAAAAPKPDDAGPWTYRDDPFSSYRPGFEVRTGRLCQRVLMFHHFPGESGVGNDCLVRSTDFTYSHEQDPTSARNPVYTFLLAVTQTGYKRRTGGYLKRSLPPVEYHYTLPTVQDTVQDVDASSLENLPIGVDGGAYQWTDLHGEGIPGILVEQGGAWFYKRNVSPINVKSSNGVAHTEAKFAAVESVAAKPNLALAGGQAQFLDLAGDGQPDLVVLDGPLPGLYEHDGDEGWQPFRPFTSRLNRDMRDPNLKFVDLDGDGHADVLISEDDALVWHASLAEEGFGPARRAHQALDEEKGPRLVLADGTESIYLADLSGDGLTDLVRIRNGEVCYWPNLGYGRFGAKVTMDRAPLFDHPDQFDHKRIRLADIDGTGTTDIVYLHREGVRLYFNQSGNSWSAPQPLRVFPRVDDLVTITATDLLGNGTACLVWSSPLPGDARRQMRYVDLMGGQKPHLLVRTVNNLGAETRVQYAPSTKFYLRDKYDGKPWITRLPFPVHVVERVETYDQISRNRFLTRYAYHHGYFDGEEREFRGFGMVEQQDTEQFAALSSSDDFPIGDNIDAASHVPPVLTRTWFHTGAYRRDQEISRLLAREYFGAPQDTVAFEAWAKNHLLDDTALPEVNLSADEQRQAVRALKGTMLRQEVYALDGTDKAEIPYTVAEQNFTIRRLQPHDGNRHAVFFTHAREAITYHYERNRADPRISHALTLAVDEYGNVLRSVAIGYPRAAVPERQREQNQTHVTLTLSRFANRDDQRNWRHIGLSVETRTFEVVKPPTATHRFTWKALSDLVTALVSLSQHEPPLANTIPYEQWAWRRQWNPQNQPGGLVDNVPKHTRLRLIEHVRTLYRKNNLTAFLPLGDIQSLALPGESYKLALTPGLLAQVFKRKSPGQPDEDLLPNPGSVLAGKADDHGGYIALDGNWWIPSGRTFFDPGANAANPTLTAALELVTARQHFYLPRRFTDPFGHNTLVEYDGYDLLVTRTRDALSNTVAAANDYRVLQARLITDPNRNRIAAAFDAVGLVVATAVMGKDGDNVDRLEGFDPDPPLATLQAFIAAPQAQAKSLLGKATTRIVYDLERYQRAGQPPFAATLARETHFHARGGAQTKVQISLSYSDGFGREIQKKIQAEAGDAPKRQAPVPLPSDDLRPGELVRNAQGELVQANAPRRWVGTGRTVFNNKGKPVRQYEPYFSATHLYEPEREMTDTGVSPVLFYDPVERVVATLHPNDTYEKVVFDPWQQATYDVNDTVARFDTQTGDPRTDQDIAGYVSEYFKTQPATWQTWHAQRIGNQLGAAQRDAAQKTAAHSDTPTVAHLDTLGRPFVTIAHNRYERNGAIIDERSPTRVELDIEGNQRAVRDAIEQNGDALGRIVMRYDYDLLGNRIHQASMEAGERWMLTDVAGKPIRAWDSRRFLRRMTYDQLRRPTGLYVTENGAERLAERTVYGEGVGDAKNHRSRVYQVFDGAGKVTNKEYDFKGNLLESRRDLLPNYKQAVNWLQNPTANDGSFTNGTTFDALNRPVTVTTPDSSVYRPTFNEANLLDKVAVNLRGATMATPFVTDIDYDAKGQRERIAYGNGALSTYDYDPLTLRLTHLKTTRPANPDTTASQLFKSTTVVQDLHYTYDPAGNITRIEDAALKAVFHNGQQIQPVSSYTYDALYRLIEAQSREHIGQTAFDFSPANGDYRDYPSVGYRAHPNDLKALRNYTERYEYDTVGNFEVLRHLATGGNWTRRYDYEEDSLTEAGKKSNRLTRTRLGNGINRIEPYPYDAHGNTRAMPHLAAMVWNFEDQLQQVDLGGGGTAHYVYDAAGQRMRKVIESQTGKRRKERIYLGGFETYREYDGNGVTVTLERESLHVMDDKQRIALVETRTKENSNPITAPIPVLRFQLGNHLGSATVELAKDAALISYEEYHPYGTAAFQAGRSAAEVGSRRYRFTGKERDEENGLYYHGTRYYAPWLGRWVACDSSGINDGLNLYTYVHCNPCVQVDSSGNAGEPPQIHLVEQPELRQPVTATVAGRGYGGWLPKTYQALGGQWMLGPVDVGDPENMPFARTPPGTTRGLRVQPRAENQELGRTVVKTEVAAARAAGQPVRNDDAWPTGTKGTRFGQPSPLPKLQGVRVNDPVQLKLPLEPRARPSTPSPPLAPAQQLELPFRPAAAQGGATAPAPSAAPTSALQRFWSAAANGPAKAVGGALNVVGGMLRAAGGALKQMGKSMIPGAEFYDYAKYTIGGGSLAAGLRGAAAGLKMAIGKAVAALTAEVTAGAAATVAVTGAAIAAAAGAVTWAVEDTRRALRGEKTMTDIATETYGKLGFVGTMQAFWGGIAD